MTATFASKPENGKECPTCGSEFHGIRLVVASLDPAVTFKKKPTKQHNDFVVENGTWFSGSCPDKWHDETRKKEA